MAFDPKQVRKVAAFTEKLTDLFNDFGYVVSGVGADLRVVEYTGEDDFSRLPFIVRFNAVTERYEMDVTQ